jgi:hypothetical protein
MSNLVKLNDLEIKWIKNRSYGFPLWIALTWDSDRMVYFRHRFVFIAAKNFTRENIRRALPGLAKELDVPDELQITAFSDKEMLRRAINNLRGPVYRIANTPEGINAAQEYAEKYLPLKSGYYRAWYYHSRDGKESLQYSPDPAKEEMVFIEVENSSIK